MTQDDEQGPGDPMAQLLADHALIRKLMTEIEVGDSWRAPDALPRLLTALQRHTRREERVLYDLFAPRLDGEEGAIGVLRGDHEAILERAEALTTSLGRGQGGEVREETGLLARSLREHLDREELVLFPFVRIRLSEAERGRLADRLAPGAD